MKRRTVKKALAAVLAGTMSACLLAGCGGGTSGGASDTSGSSDSGSSDGNTELRVTVQAWMMGKYDFEEQRKALKPIIPG